MLTELKLVVWKNLIIRKRHWLLALTETVIPILLFCIVAYGRSKISGMNKEYINETTYNFVTDFEALNHNLPVAEIKIWYTPYTETTEKIIKSLQLQFQISSNDIQEFGSEEHLLEHYAKHSNATVAAIVFRSGNEGKKLDYDIRMFEKYTYWDTSRLYNPFDGSPGTGSDRYINSGFLALQLAIDLAFIELNNPKNVLPQVNIQMEEFPIPPHKTDSGINDIFLNFLPIITVFSFMFLCPMVLKRVVEEKFTGIKELMKMVGMKSWMLWLGWFIHALTANLFSIVFIVFLMKAKLWDVPYAPIEYCDWSILFVFLFLYCIAAVSFCFLIASLFNRPSIAMVVGILAWISSYAVPREIVRSYETMVWRYKVLFGIFPNMALHYGYSAISVYEEREVGVNWSNIFKPGSNSPDDVTMGNVFVMFIIDTVLFMVLAAYVDGINPGNYGIPKPFYFPLLRLKKNFSTFVHTYLRRGSAEVGTETPGETVSLNKIEDGLGLGLCIRISNLKKKYGPNVAVDDLNMDIYKDQITVLLGHNGAGKTTTMSIITGMISATSGSIKINGVDIRNDLNDMRRNIGLCPQHNLLFTDLTVLEHLKFFSMLKGASCAQAEKEALELLNKFSLLDKRDVLACTLSGGMKRKLCLGMAVIGNSSILILDEPTSGMDPENRRKVWDMLLEIRQSKTILITTHFMEEADVLGDRIAIMADGRLQCYGTPMFLKEKYATGYHVSLLLRSTDFIPGISTLVQGCVPQARLIRENGESIVFMLPLNARDSYSKLFKELSKQEDKIANTCLSLTTLNDVFLKVQYEHDKTRAVTETDGVNKEVPPVATSKRQIIRGLFWKRWYFLRRNILWYIPAVVMMMVIFLATIFLSQKSSDFESDAGPKLNLNLSIYGNTGVFYGGEIHPKDHFIEKLKTAYKDVVTNEMSEPLHVKDVSEAIVEKGIENIAYYKRHMVAAANFFNSDEGVVTIKAMYSNSAKHGAAISLNLATNAYAKAVLGSDYSIRVYNEPLQRINAEVSPAEMSLVEVAMLWAILMPIGLLFLVGNFIIFPNYEVSTNFIRIQVLSGVRPFCYWLWTLLFDYGVLLTQIVLIMVVILISNLAYTTQVFGCREYIAVTCIFLCYGVGVIPFVYIFGYKRTVAGGFASWLMVGMFTGIVLTVVVYVLEFYDEDYKRYGTALRHISFVFFPQFSLSYICLKFSRKYTDNYNWVNMESSKRDHICKMEPTPCCPGGNAGQCSQHQSYLYSKDFGISSDLWEMMLPAVIYFSLLCFLNTSKSQMLWECVQLHQKQRWQKFKSVFRWPFYRRPSMKSDDQFGIISLQAEKVVKSYGNKEAVRNIGLSLKKKDCFGLLGVNGAGKTTFFRMLASDIPCDQGTINSISKDNKYKVLVGESEYLEQIGYCPQNDALNYALTGRELLTTMAMLRGYPSDQVNKVVDFYLNIFDLRQYADRPCLDYSGGNKRKLSMCIAFMGFPKIVLLDEPTSGVDPASRLSFWDTLLQIKKSKDTTFVLCSHSMEECEVLCDKIAIMKEGEIKAEGTLGELKQEYQKGFTIVFKLKPTLDASKSTEDISVDVVDGPASSARPQSAQEALANVINAKFGNKGEVTDRHSGMITYHLKDPHKKLAELFDEVDALKRENQIIEDYSISGTTLEDVFLKIAEDEDKNF